MGTLPFALVGGLWLLFVLGYDLSIASVIGFIALAGVAAEFGIVMLIYLDHAIAKRRPVNRFTTERDLVEAIERRCCAASKTEGNDGRSHRSGSFAYHVGRRYRL